MKILQALFIFFVAIIVTSLIVLFQLPAPPLTPIFVHLINIVLLVFIGPFLFFWAWGPQPISIYIVVLYIFAWLLSVVLIVIWFKKINNLLLLICSAVILSAIGGLSAYLAISGSI
jgi:hypothetical protein